MKTKKRGKDKWRGRYRERKERTRDKRCYSERKNVFGHSH